MLLQTHTRFLSLWKPDYKNLDYDNGYMDFKKRAMKDFWRVNENAEDF